MRFRAFCTLFHTPLAGVVVAKVSSGIRAMYSGLSVMKLSTVTTMPSKAGEAFFLIFMLTSSLTSTRREAPVSLLVKSTASEVLEVKSLLQYRTKSFPL